MPNYCFATAGYYLGEDDRMYPEQGHTEMPVEFRLLLEDDGQPPPGETLDPMRLMMVYGFYNILLEFAEDMGARASFLLDWDRRRCALQLRNIQGLSFLDRKEQDQFTRVLLLSRRYEICEQSGGGLCVTLEYELSRPFQ